jgi:hypothetical protein
MGYAVSWLAVRGKPAHQVLDELRLRGTGEYDKSPYSPHLWGTELPVGWYLIYANRCEFLDQAPIERLSTGAEVVTCLVEEHVMVSEAAGWKDGQRRWFAAHDADVAIEHITAEGDLPPVFTSIRDRLAAEQAQEDEEVDYYFDIPVELALAVTSFRYGAGIPGSDDKPFERLQP